VKTAVTRLESSEEHLPQYFLGGSGSGSRRAASCSGGVARGDSQDLGLRSLHPAHYLTVQTKCNKQLLATGTL
jgi:hypothetical protein